MDGLGCRILVDLYACSTPLLNDATYIEASMKKAAQAAGATIVDSTFHHFSPHGVTGVLAIKESHLAIHTWPEYGFAAVDLFTCGQGINPWKAYAVLKEALQATHSTTSEIHRGQPRILSQNK